jgi:hypothetical protein
MRFELRTSVAPKLQAGVSRMLLERKVELAFGFLLSFDFPLGRASDLR